MEGKPREMVSYDSHNSINTLFETVLVVRPMGERTCGLRKGTQMLQKRRKKMAAQSGV